MLRTSLLLRVEVCLAHRKCRARYYRRSSTSRNDTAVAQHAQLRRSARALGVPEQSNESPTYVRIEWVGR